MQRYGISQLPVVRVEPAQSLTDVVGSIQERALLDRVFKNADALNEDVAVAMQPPARGGRRGGVARRRLRRPLRPERCRRGRSARPAGRDPHTLRSARVPLRPQDTGRSLSALVVDAGAACFDNVARMGFLDKLLGRTKGHGRRRRRQGRSGTPTRRPTRPATRSTRPRISARTRSTRRRTSLTGKARRRARTSTLPPTQAPQPNPATPPRGTTRHAVRAMKLAA